MARMFQPVLPGPSDNKKRLPGSEQKDGKRNKTGSKPEKTPKEDVED